MKELWHRTVELIRRYPVLWLPVIWAALLSYGWGQLRLIILHDVLPLVFRQQSVLGGYVPDTSHLKAVEFFILAAINTNVCEFTDVCCYIVALLMTAKMLGRLTAANGRDNPYSEISIANHGAGVLVLGLIVFVLAYVFIPLVFAPILYYANSAHRTSILTRPYVLAPEVLLLYMTLAYFVTPMALKLLFRPKKHLVDAESISRGRKFSLLAGATITLLSLIQMSISKSYLQGLSGSATFGVLSTVFVALPYIGLFVALSLVAADSVPDEADFVTAESGAEAHLLREVDSGA
jgi:hypothetical protein